MSRGEWYQTKAEHFGYQAIVEIDCNFPEAAHDNARLAAHFGLLALEYEAEGHTESPTRHLLGGDMKSVPFEEDVPLPFDTEDEPEDEFGPEDWDEFFEDAY